MKQVNFESMMLSAVKATVKQGCQSSDAVSCLYRDSNGNKCVIGQMIPDTKYLEAMERETVYIVVQLCGFTVTKGQIETLKNLQLCHDNAVGPKSFNEHFKAKISRQVATGVLPIVLLQAFDEGVKV